MIRYLTLILSALIGTMSAYAIEADTQTYEEAATYFSRAGILDSTLILTCKEKFVNADMNKKTQLIRYMLTLSNTRRAVVESDNISWIWYFYNSQLYYYECDTSENLIDNYNYAQVDRLGSDKWFCTVGGEISFSSITSIGINGRVGTYLWKRFLDAGLGLNVGYYSGEGTEDWDISVNLTSRFYFTRLFSKWSLSPFVGIGAGYVFCPEMNFDILGSVGLNWYLPKGSIDFAMQYGNISKFGITAGYTISF